MIHANIKARFGSLTALSDRLGALMGIFMADLYIHDESAGELRPGPTAVLEAPSLRLHRLHKLKPGFAQTFALRPREVVEGGSPPKEARLLSPLRPLEASPPASPHRRGSEAEGETKQRMMGLIETAIVPHSAAAEDNTQTEENEGGVPTPLDHSTTGERRIGEVVVDGGRGVGAATTAARKKEDDDD